MGKYISCVQEPPVFLCQQIFVSASSTSFCHVSEILPSIHRNKSAHDFSHHDQQIIARDVLLVDEESNVVTAP